MDNQEKILEQLAGAVSDGAPPDWGAADAEGRGLRSKVQHLRLVESIAAAHRALRESEPASWRSGTEGSALAETTISEDPSPTEAISSWGHLEIRERLGQGGFGEVYRAYDPKLDTEVALKLRRSDRAGEDPFEGRFLAEARQLAKVRHPNVLSVFGADEHDGRVGLWTELLEGQTLEEVLWQQGVFSAQEAAVAAIDLLHGLAAVHATGLLHRDIKTSNVMRARGGRIVLMDFGSVTEVRPEEGSDARVSGTPLAMAPEILRGERAAIPSDIYSVGVLLYRLVSHRYPVEAETLPSLMDGLQRGFTPLRDVRPDLPGGFIQVVERALDADPSRRFQSAGAMETALAAVIGSSGSLPSPTSDPGRGKASGRGRRWVWAAVLGVVLVGGGFGVIRWVERKPGPATIREEGTVPPPPAGPRSAARPFHIEAALMRQEADGVKELSANARLSVNDRLYLEVESNEPAHYYVINEDQVGNAYVLFPSPLWDQQNPVPAGRIKLPGRQGGEERMWQVDSAGGVETFLLIASRKPLPEIEAELRRFAQAGSGPVASLPAESRARLKTKLRGVGGVAAMPSPDPGQAGLLSGINAELDELATAEAGIEVREFRMENPIE